MSVSKSSAESNNPSASANIIENVNLCLQSNRLRGFWPRFPEIPLFRKSDLESMSVSKSYAQSNKPRDSHNQTETN